MQRVYLHYLFRPWRFQSHPNGIDVRAYCEYSKLLCLHSPSLLHTYIHMQWHELVVGFREGMPRHRRRVKMRLYDECFTGSEAVQWLHKYLQNTGSFGTVSKQQVSCRSFIAHTKGASV